MSIASPPYHSSRQDPVSTPDRNLPVGLARLVSADRRREHVTGASHGLGPLVPRISGPVAVILAKLWEFPLSGRWPGVDGLVGGSTLQVALQRRRQRTAACRCAPIVLTWGCRPSAHKDLRSLLGRPVAGAFKTRFCGAGNLTACRSSLWQALNQAGDALAAAQATNDPTQWRSDATAERIRFLPGFPTTMRWTHRPRYPQAISYSGHR
jgi:hypothetical protein